MSKRVFRIDKAQKTSDCQSDRGPSNGYPLALCRLVRGRPRKMKGDRLLRESSKQFWRIGVFCVLVLAACTSGVQKKTSAESQPASEAPTVPLGISINAVMVGLVDH